MKREFVTASGSVIIERNVLFIRRKKFGADFFKVIQVLLPIVFALRFVDKLSDEPGPGRNLRLVMYGFLALISAGPLLYIMFHKSFSNLIPLQTIVSFSVDDDLNGLEQHLILKLSSGRERIITFRKLENQLLALLAVLEPSKISVEMA